MTKIEFFEHLNYKESEIKNTTVKDLIHNFIMKNPGQYYEFSTFFERIKFINIIGNLYFTRYNKSLAVDDVKLIKELIEVLENSFNE